MTIFSTVVTSIIYFVLRAAAISFCISSSDIFNAFFIHHFEDVFPLFLLKDPMSNNKNKKNPNCYSHKHFIIWSKKLIIIYFNNNCNSKYLVKKDIANELE